MDYYKQIFKRKSFHIFKDTKTIIEDDLLKLKAFCDAVKPLDTNIRTKICIVPEKETSCRRGGEYCILFYSEIKDEYLRNMER